MNTELSCFCSSRKSDLVNIFTAQLHRLQEDIEHLRKEKESEISNAQNELLRAQCEILLLQQMAEKAASERDTDVAALQEELQKVRAELEKWRREASEYEKEIMDLQASFQQRCRQCEDKQKKEASRLQGMILIKIKMLCLMFDHTFSCFA